MKPQELIITGETCDKQTYHPLVVKEIIYETCSAKTFVFEIPHHLKAAFRYRAGQFITVRLLIDNALHTRRYSISSGEQEGLIEITVKGHGTISSYLNKKVRLGDRIHILPPSGQFVLPPQKESHFLFFAGGSGITPLFSMISTLLVENPSANIHLLYVNHNKAQTIFFQRIETLAARHINFNVDFIFTAPETSSQSELHGRPSQKMLKLYLQQILKTKRSCYLCAPAELMREAAAVLEKEGIPKESIHTEAFYSIRNTQQPNRSDQISGKNESRNSGTSDAETPEQVIVTLRGREYTLDIDADTSILDAALKAGLNAPFSCQEGICGTCMATLKEGKVAMEKHDALTNEEIQQKKILTCQAKLRSRQCRVSYDD